MPYGAARCERTLSLDGGRQSVSGRSSPRLTGLLAVFAVSGSGRRLIDVHDDVVHVLYLLLLLLIIIIIISLIGRCVRWRQLSAVTAAGRRRRDDRRRSATTHGAGRAPRRRPVRQEEPTFGHSLDERRRRLADPPPLRRDGRRRLVDGGYLGRGVEDRSTRRRRRTDELDVRKRLHPLEARPARLHRRRQLARVALVDDRLVRLRHHLHTCNVTCRIRRYQRHCHVYAGLFEENRNSGN